MNDVLLAATHLFAFAVGALASWWVCRDVADRAMPETAHRRPPRENHHMPNRIPRRVLLPIVVIVAALVVVGIGIQARLAAQDNAARDRADAAYSACLTRFASDLVDTLRARTDLQAELNDAGDRKDALLDELLRITAKVQASGATDQSQVPPKVLAHYEHVLNARVKAQDHYDKVKAELEAARAQNPYEKPTATCRR